MKAFKDPIDQLIDQAAAEMPLEPVPAGLFSRIMAEIEPMPVVVPFRLSWIDFGFSLTLAMISGFFLDVLQGFIKSPFWAARLQVASMLLWRDLRIFAQQNQAYLLAALISGCLLLFVFLVLAGIYRRTAPRTASGTARA